jgi:hypothetical protein
MLFGYSYLLLFTSEVATNLSINSYYLSEDLNCLSFIPFLKSKLNLPKKDNKIFIILAVFFTRIKKEIIELITPFRLIKLIYSSNGFRAVLKHILQHLKDNYIIYLKNIGWFIIFAFIVFLVRKGFYYIIFNNASFSIKDLFEIFKYDAILVFLFVRFNNKIIIILLFRLFKNPLWNAIVEIDKCYNTNIVSSLEKLYSIFKVRGLIEKFKSFKSNIESYMINLFNLLKNYRSKVKKPLILMTPATLQASSSTAPQSGARHPDSNTTAPTSSAETESSFLKLVKDHHLLNPNIDFINREKVVLNVMIENVENKLKPLEKKRLEHLQNGGSNNNTSQFFTVDDSTKYLGFSNKINTLKESLNGLTAIFKDLDRIRQTANDLESTKKDILTVIKPQLLETQKQLDLLSNTQKQLEKKRIFNDLDPKKNTFTKDDSQKLTSTESEILKLKKLEYDLQIKLEGKEVFISTFTNVLKKERIYPVERESQIVSEAISDNNPVW